MSVAEMQAQFMPPPFGAPAKPTAFEAMLDAQARAVDGGKVDMDKESVFGQGESRGGGFQDAQARV